MLMMDFKSHALKRKNIRTSMKASLNYSDHKNSKKTNIPGKDAILKANRRLF